MVKRTLTLIDGSGYIFRAYYGLPPMNRSDGLPCNAVYGFCSMIWRILETRQNNLIACVFDSARKTFRSDIYPDYKANRSDPPEDLVPQFPFFREAANAFGLPVIEKMGYEADDLIATYTRIAKQQNMNIEIISGDKDLMQLVDDGVKIIEPMKNKVIHFDEVHEKFGVSPKQVIYVQALAGDNVDNVPGVAGIGPKIAAELINHYGDLEKLLSSVDEIKQPKRRQSLIDNKEKARISLKLVTLEDNAPIDQDIHTLEQFFDYKKLHSFFSYMEFHSLIKRLPYDTEETISVQENVKQEYHIINTIDTLTCWLKKAYNTRILCVSFIKNNQQDDHPFALALSLDKAIACMVPITMHETLQQDLPTPDSYVTIDLEDALLALKPYLDHPAILKIGYDIKQIFHHIGHHHLHAQPFHDILVQSFTLFAGLHNFGLGELAMRYMDYQMLDIEKITGSGRQKKHLQNCEQEKLLIYAAEQADMILRLHHVFMQKLTQNHMQHFYHHIEKDMPLICYHIERNGIKIDAAHLQNLHEEFTAHVESLENDIFTESGEKFNISSPKQLGHILFEKLQIPHQGKTKSGQYSTSVDVLEPLGQQYTIIQNILEYRHYSKLLNTYIDSLPRYIHEKTKRIHTCFHLIGAQTGRLSSNDPNVQNIPVKDIAGKKIRSAFIAPEEHYILSCDYSQIELRILAQMSKSPSMLKAFSYDIDIHSLTASEIFNVPLSSITPDKRRAAKAINFGIIYGMSAFGLAKQIGCTRSEASTYIKAYFHKFDGIKDFFDSTIQDVKEKKYAETIFGRKVHLPHITATNSMQRQYAERQAMNAPIQGSAADIIKRAMIKIDRLLRHPSHNISQHCRMILQVHDELLFEVEKKHIEETAQYMQNIMEKATEPLLHLDVTLKVDYGYAKHWGDAH